MAMLQILMKKYSVQPQTSTSIRHSTAAAGSQSQSISASSCAKDEEEVDEPCAKARKVGDKRDKSGTPCKRWDPKHTAYAIEVLCDLALQGQKCAKTFKTPGLHLCVDAVNAKFNETYTFNNMKNHYKGLKGRWKDIQAIMKESGGGWDESEKKIILSEAMANDLIKVKSERKQYINVPLPYDLDQLRIVCGEDHATGSFRKDAYASLGSNPDKVIMVDEEPSKDPQPPGDVSMPSQDQTFIGSSSSKKKEVEVKELSRRKKKQNEDVAAVAMEKFVDCVKWLGDAIVTAHSQDTSHKWLKELNEIVMSTPGEYTDEELDKAFTSLAADEHYARIFMAKNPHLQLKEMDGIFAKFRGGHQGV